MALVDKPIFEGVLNITFFGIQIYWFYVMNFKNTFHATRETFIILYFSEVALLLLEFSLLEFSLL